MMPPLVQARLTREPIDASSLAREIAGACVGATASFVGVVRGERHSGGPPLEALSYSAYEPMALATMEQIAGVAADRFDLHGIRVVHRLGRLGIGEASIAVVVSAPHRAAAFDACREIVERVKADAPIFKQEHWGDGAATWKEGI